MEDKLSENEYKIFDFLINEGMTKAILETLDVEYEEAQQIIAKGRKKLELDKE